MTDSGNDPKNESTGTPKRTLSTMDSQALGQELDSVLSDLENLDLGGSTGVSHKPAPNSDEALLAELTGDFQDEDDGQTETSEVLDPDSDEALLAELILDDEGRLYESVDETSLEGALPAENSDVTADAVVVADIADDEDPDTDGTGKSLEQETNQQVEELRAQIRESEELLDTSKRRISILNDELVQKVARIQTLENTQAAAQDKLSRTVADFANYRKRMEREKKDAITFANEKILKDILPVIDSLQIALAHEGHSQSNEFVSGVRMVCDLMLQTLSRFGLKSFASVGEPFDPLRHEAMTQVFRDDLEDKTVVDELQCGYFLHERLLRPAKVSVSTAIDPNAPKPEEAIREDSDLEHDADDHDGDSADLKSLELEATSEVDENSEEIEDATELDSEKLEAENEVDGLDNQQSETSSEPNENNESEAMLADSSSEERELEEELEEESEDISEFDVVDSDSDDLTEDTLKKEDGVE